MNMYSQYIEDFVDHSTTVPRDVIRNCKLVAEEDEISNKVSKRLADNRRQFLQIKRNKGEKHEDLKEKIDQDYNYLLNLNDMKQEALLDIEKIVKKHMEELKSTIEKYEKEYITPYASTAANTSQLDSSYIEPSGKSVKDKARNGFSNHHNQSFTSNGNHNHKKNNSNFMDSSYSTVQVNSRRNNSKKGQLKNASMLDETSLMAGSENVVENNELYCFCQGVSYGDMIGCDNDSCKFQWFHFKCVGLEMQPEGEWYCSDECREKSNKRKRKKRY